MYLMDQIAEVNNSVMKRGEDNHPIMAIFPMLHNELEGCPRFIFDEDTINTAVELTLGRPKVMWEAMSNLTIPYKKIWIEWPESGRHRLREIFTETERAQQNKLRPLPDKIGFLLKTFETPRRGMVYWVWNSPKSLEEMLPSKFYPPNVCPISAYFDLNRCHIRENMLHHAFLDSNLGNLWKDNEAQLNALKVIWGTSEHQLSKWGNIYMDYICRGDEKSRDLRLNHFYADVYGEYIMVWACLLLLTSSKKIVNYTPTDFVKLNKARAKQNKVAKLDHTRVTMYIPREVVEPHAPGAPLGYKRKSPRIHMVSSFLNRRGDKHWIVQPFWRGKGEVISRHVHVKVKK